MNDSTTPRQDALHPEDILKEAAVIAEARAHQVQNLQSLGLSVPDELLTFVTARSQAAVDRCLRRRAEDSRELDRMIARCERRALGAA